MHRMLFNLLFIVGLGIIGGGFFLVVPVASRCNVAYLNAGVIFLIYLSYWINYGIIFPSKGDAGDFLAGSGIYWHVQGTYTFLCVLVMVSGWALGWKFSTQLLLQIVALFIFLIYVVCSVFAIEHVSKCTSKDRATMTSVRDLQQMSASISARAALLPADWTEAKQSVLKLEEELNYFSGIENPISASIDEKIMVQLRYLQSIISDGQNMEAVQKTAHEIMSLILQRKIIKTQDKGAI